MSENILVEKNIRPFALVDRGIGYRLPRRYGIIQLEGKNLFDEKFDFQGFALRTPRSQEEDPLFVAERTISAQIKLAF